MEDKMMSLYDYLGRAAGSELGKQVATCAAELNVKYGIKHVSNATYTGEIMMYPQSFLDWYFRKPDTEEMMDESNDIDLQF